MASWVRFETREDFILLLSLVGVISGFFWLQTAPSWSWWLQPFIADANYLPLVLVSAISYRVTSGKSPWFLLSLSSFRMITNKNTMASWVRFETNSFVSSGCETRVLLTTNCFFHDLCGFSFAADADSFLLLEPLQTCLAASGKWSQLSSPVLWDDDEQKHDGFMIALLGREKNLFLRFPLVGATSGFFWPHPFSSSWWFDLSYIADTDYYLLGVYNLAW